MKRETIENRMVVDSEWPEHPKEAPEKLNGPGYREMFTGVFVTEEDAFDYAMDRCVLFVPEGFRKIEWTQEFRKMLMEWFFSDSWIWED